MYASIFLTFSVTFVASCSLQFGQNIASWFFDKSMELLIILSTYILSNRPLPAFLYSAISVLQYPQDTIIM